MRTNSFTNRMELIVALVLATARRNGQAAIRTSEALRNLRAEQTAYDRAVAAKKVLLRSAQRRYESAIREAAKKWAAAQTLSDRRVGSYAAPQSTLADGCPQPEATPQRSSLRRNSCKRALPPLKG